MEYYHWRTGVVVDESDAPAGQRATGQYLPLSGGGIRYCAGCVHSMLWGACCNVLAAKHGVRPLTTQMRIMTAAMERKYPHLRGKLCYDGKLWEERNAENPRDRKEVAKDKG